jgi:hypothetical protein
MESEAELLQQKRLQNVQGELQRYNENEDAGVGREAIRMKRKQLEQLAKEDSIEISATQLNYETIGIDLMEILKNPKSKYDLILQDGDVLSIPRQLQTVRMRGELLYPITVRYDEGLSFKDYISRSGGFQRMREEEKLTCFTQMAPSIGPENLFFGNNYPKVEAGAEIIVPKKPERQQLTAQAWIALSTSIATLALVVQQITR